MEINTWEDPIRIDEFHTGGKRRVLGYTDEMMLVHYSLNAGEEGSPHNHEDTVQASFVIEGCLELLGEYSATIKAGDSYLIPPGTVHGVRATEPCKVLDVFSPPLDQYKST